MALKVRILKLKKGQLTVFFERSLGEKHDSLEEPQPLLKGRSQLMSIKRLAVAVLAASKQRLLSS